MSVSTRALKPASVNTCEISVNTIRAGAVQLTYRELVALDQPNDTGPITFDRRIGDRTHDAFGRMHRSSMPSGSSALMRWPSCSPPNFWKNHHGTPF